MMGFAQSPSLPAGCWIDYEALREAGDDKCMWTIFKCATSFTYGLKM